MQATTDYRPEAEARHPLPEAPVTLGPQDFMRFLGVIEQGMPKGIRAYVVTLDEGGQRNLQPVSDTSSVVDLNSNLIDHLSEKPLSQEYMLKLHDYLSDRLQHQGYEGAEAFSKLRRNVTGSALYEIALISGLLQEHIFQNDQSGAINPVSRGILARIELLADAVGEATEVCGSDWTDEQLERVVNHGGGRPRSAGRLPADRTAAATVPTVTARTVTSAMVSATYTISPNVDTEEAVEEFQCVFEAAMAVLQTPEDNTSEQWGAIYLLRHCKALFDLLSARALAAGSV